MRAIVHRLIKEKNTQSAEIRLRDSLLPENAEMLDVLLSETRKGINKSSGFANFARDVDGAHLAFERFVRQYLQEDTAVDFYNFSKNAVEKLQELIAGKVAATGGYVLFADYSDSNKEGGERYILVALITNQQLPAINDDLELIPALVLNLDKLKHGVRVKVSGLTENSDGVLTVISKRRSGKDLAEYFSDFVGSAEFTNSRLMGVMLKERVDQWSDQQGFGFEERSRLHSKIHSHWAAQEGAKYGISMEALANEIYPESPTEFHEFLTDETDGLPEQTPPIRSQDVKRFKKFLFRGAGLVLEYDLDGDNGWQNRIVKHGSDAIIRNAPEELLKDLPIDE